MPDASLELWWGFVVPRYFDVRRQHQAARYRNPERYLYCRTRKEGVQVWAAERQLQSENSCRIIHQPLLEIQGCTAVNHASTGGR